MYIIFKFIVHIVTSTYNHDKKNPQKVTFSSAYVDFISVVRLNGNVSTPSWFPPSVPSDYDIGSTV